MIDPIERHLPKHLLFSKTIIITMKNLRLLCWQFLLFSGQVEAVGPAYYRGSFQIGPSSPAPLPYILQQAKTKGQSHNTKEENKRTEVVGGSPSKA